MASLHVYEHLLVPIYFHLKLAGLESNSLHLQRWTFTAFMLATIATIVVMRAIYNRYFHSLKHIPGPFWGSITDAYKLVALLTKDVTQFSLDLHERYGPVVRVAPDLVSVSDPNMLPIIYHRRADKDDFYTPGAAGEHVPMLQIRNHEDHQRKKKVCSPILSRSNLAQYEDRIDKSLSKLTRKLKYSYSRIGRSVNISDWTKWFLSDTTSDIVFGNHTGSLDHGQDVGGVLGAFRESAWLIGLMAVYPYIVEPIINLPIIRDIAIPRSGGCYGIGKIMTQRDHLIKHSKPSTTNSLYSQFLTHQHTHPEPLSKADISAELLTMMIAAPHTTSAVICAFISNITSHPANMSRIRQEISTATRNGFFSHPHPTYSEIRSLPFFNACIYETLRLSPPIPVLLPRRAPSGGLYLNGVFIPEGTSIGACAPVINRDNNVFGADSHHWRPERWLESESRSRTMKRFLFTFGWGTRKCVGMEMALMEASKLCIELIEEFDITVTSACEREESKGFAFYEGLEVLLRDRSVEV